MHSRLLIEAHSLQQEPDVVIVDCRFSLADTAQGHALYTAGHIPGAHYLDLNHDMSCPVQQHGGRHPLPDARTLAGKLASFGIGPETRVVAYDDSGFAYAARLWWLMRSLGFKPPQLLNGGFQAWVELGGEIEQVTPLQINAGPVAGQLTGFCDIQGLRRLLDTGCVLVDSREARRYQGLEEPIDPVAGHIPGAINHPWQGVTDETGRILDEQGLRDHWGETLEAEQLALYCGSGVTACVNLFSLSLLGRDDAVLYAGSWSDWCSYL